MPKATPSSASNLSGSNLADQMAGDDGRNLIAGRSGNDLVLGNGGDDSLSGEAGDDNLRGGDGNDTFDGGAGADTQVGGADVDLASYAGSTSGVAVSVAGGTGEGGDTAGDILAGIENLVGSGAGDTLTGDFRSNALSGGGGNDMLGGAAGADILKGGAGADRFAYAAIGDSTVGAAGRDIIADFAMGDRIDLSAIDADGNAGNGNTEFVFGTGAFTGQAGEVRVVNYGGGRQGVYLDVNGDTAVDAIIEVYAAHGLTVEDFVL